MRAWRLRGALPAATHSPHDDRPGGGQTQKHRDRGLTDVPREGEPKRLADEHVLRIADERERRTDVGGGGQRKEKRNRIEPPAEAGVDQHRRHGETNDVVAEDGSQSTNHCHERSEQHGRCERKGRESEGHASVKAAEAQLLPRGP